MKRILMLMGVLLFMSASLFGQTIRITGTVTNQADGTSLPGVTVMVMGTAVGTITDANGRYEINAAGDATLVFSFVGMRTAEVPVEGRAMINIALEPEVIAIEEFVVVGYGVQRRREVTGAISQIRGEDFANLATPSFDQQLKGRIAGAQITQTTGVLGVAPRIRIRGIASITSGTFPLVVVDGIPIFTGELGGYTTTNALADINPADIESVEVLKDGAATAIYGSRAAAGVILITTRRGQEGRFRLDYNNYFGIAQPTRLFDLTSTDEWMPLINEMFANAAVPNPFVMPQPEPMNTDWQRAVLRDRAFQQDHNISLSGASARTSYFFSLGYTDQEGVTRPNTLNRFSLRANVDQKVGDRLTVGINANLARTKIEGLNTGESALSGNIFSAIRQLPNTPVYNPAHPTGYNIDIDNPALVGRGANNNRNIDDLLPNIRYVIDHNINNSLINRATIGTFGIVNILPSLVFQTRFGVDASLTEGLLYWNPTHGDGRGVLGRVHNAQTNMVRWNVTNTLSFVETFAERHNFNITLVQEAGKLHGNEFWAAGTQLSDPFWGRGLIGGTFATQLSGGSMWENGILSYAGRLNYNFDGRYFLQLSARYDGLSALPAGHKWGFFPAASVGWTISREAFMQNIDWISDLRIRASYAEVGNSAIGNYPALGLFGGVRYADHTGVAFVQMANENLRWETSRKSNIGFDFEVLDGRFALTYDFFVDDADGLVLNRPLPPSFGIPAPPGTTVSAVAVNVGALRNWGHEIGLQANFIRNRNFSWTVDANLSLIRNEIKSLVGDAPIVLTFTRIAVGESIRSLYGWDFLGVNPANGNPMYRRADGSVVQDDITTGRTVLFDPANPGAAITTTTPLALLTPADRITFGPTMPTYFGAVTNTIRFGNWDFSAMVRFSGGNYIMNRTRGDLTANSFTNLGREMLGRWQSPENPGDGWTPRLWHGRTGFINRQGTTSGRFVERGDFIKLQNVILGYTLPATLVGRFGIERLRLFISGTELFTITDYTGIDPEMERGAGFDFNTTPVQRTVTLGVNLSL